MKDQCFAYSVINLIWLVRKFEGGCPCRIDGYGCVHSEKVGLRNIDLVYSANKHSSATVDEYQGNKTGGPKLIQFCLLLSSNR